MSFTSILQMPGLLPITSAAKARRPACGEAQHFAHAPAFEAHHALIQGTHIRLKTTPSGGRIVLVGQGLQYAPKNGWLGMAA